MNLALALVANKADADETAKVKQQLAQLLEEDDDPDDDEAKFTDREDLVRIGTCYHRFHLICLHRDWFMPRAPEQDQFGCMIQYKVPETKKCPICRRLVDQEEIQYVQAKVSAHPEVEDHGYELKK